MNSAPLRPAPADLAVIGVDDIPTARLAAPPLTTIAFDLREAGRGRAEMIMASLAGREPHVAAQQHWRLVARASA